MQSAAPNIVGSCTSGHDIAQDYHNNGWDVTLVQRSSTLVVTGSSALEFLGFRGIFDGTGVRLLPHNRPYICELGLKLHL